MIKKTIKYTDYDGNERTDDLYFNLTKAELMEMNFSTTGGLEKMLKKVVADQDSKKMMEIFKDLILRSYGEKSADGKRFIKVRDGRHLSEEFEQSEAYSELFMELASDENAAVEFLKGVIPQALASELAARG